MNIDLCTQKINEYNKKVRAYGKYIKELQTILYNITGGLDDEIRAVNGKIDSLQDGLYSAEKYNKSYKSHADALDYKKEKPVYSVSEYSSAISEINAEINRISNLQQNAQSQANYYSNERTKEKNRQDEEKKKKQGGGV